HVALLEDLDFTDIVVSLKASDVARTVAACRMFARDCPYPIHLGVTEAGTRRGGTVKSAIALGTLLLEGIGDTIRISLAEDPVEEVHVAWEILGAIGLRHRGVTLTACPACARASFDLVAWTRKIETVTQNARHPWRIAVMGCVVNGPGEAREADLGIVGGRENFALYRKGRLVRRVASDELLDVVREEVARLDQEREERES
ncbi:MAG: 4-hydroxy-3-methylbut-2-en-1-yl diphosphate synthase, partial [Deltaproteobacteria bacterium]